MNSSGSLLRTALGWIIAIAVAVLLISFIVSVVVGLVKTLFALAVLAAIAYGVFWVLRKS
jgi:hypothetical protein